MYQQNSVADIPEADLIKRLLADPVFGRPDIIGQVGIPRDAVDFLSVPLEGAPGNFKGDIDILLFSPAEPRRAIAIQVKKIKVGTKAMRTGHPNKLHEIEEGVLQANLAAQIGFAQVYLYLFVVVDSREATLGQKRLAGLTPELRERIRNSISVSTVGLCDRIGLMDFEFVQAFDDHPLRAGTFTGHLVRLAREVSQPTDLTDWVVSRRLAS
jgi:hypothetical protein